MTYISSEIMQPTIKNYIIYNRRLYVLFLCTSKKLFNWKPELSQKRIEMKKLIIKKKKNKTNTPKIADFTIKTGQVTWQLPAQQDICEIARFVAQPAHSSEGFKTCHTGGCGEWNIGPQLSLRWDNSHSYSLTIHASGVQVMLSVELNKPFFPLRCPKKGLGGRARPQAGARGARHGAWCGEDSWWHNGCPGQAAVALPSLAHLLRCSWFNRQEAQPKTAGPSRQRFLPARPGLSPARAGAARQEHRLCEHLLKKTERKEKNEAN